MNSMNINLNFSKLGGIVETRNGKRVVVLPIEDNNIFISDKGGIYLNLQATPLKEEMYGQSHIIKNKLPRDKYLALSKQERDSIPIVGGIKPVIYNNQDNNSASGFNKKESTSTSYSSPNNNNNSLEDLPF